MIKEILFYLFTSLGLVFFIAGTLGLLRFPDIFSRLHALTKADNLGLGFLILGFCFFEGEGTGITINFQLIAKMVFAWLLVLLASATNSHLIARFKYRSGDKKGKQINGNCN
jgi:multicomponent Na+:H+ antiporter subunit G